MSLDLNAFSRRRLLLAPLLASAASSAHASTVEGESVELWPGGVPDAEQVTVRERITERAPEGSALRDRIAEHVRRPVLTLLPARRGEQPSGISVLIIPGGGYVRVAIDKEGLETATLLADQGINCGVLRYRLPGDGWANGADAPVIDALRALRMLRASFGSPKTGVIGFSAGGHVAARLITEFTRLSYPARDAADALSSRADFAALIYPVIAMSGEFSHRGSQDQLLAGGVPREQLARYTPANHVRPDTPPTLMVHAVDDTVVPLENSQMMFDALRKNKVSSELHLFAHGGHGFGLRGAGGTLSGWPALVQSWARNAAAEDILP